MELIVRVRSRPAEEWAVHDASKNRRMRASPLWKRQRRTACTGAAVIRAAQTARLQKCAHSTPKRSRPCPLRACARLLAARKRDRGGPASPVTPKASCPRRRYHPSLGRAISLPSSPEVQSRTRPRILTYRHNKHEARKLHRLTDSRRATSRPGSPRWWPWTGGAPRASPRCPRGPP